MTYSEAKAIIKTLHAAGWRKFYDQNYVKTWNVYGEKFSIEIDFYEILQFNYPLPMLVNMLDDFDDYAQHEINKKHQERLKDS